MPGADKLLQHLKNIGLKLAIASGASLERIEKVVDRFGWENYFDELCSTDHVNFAGKPDPAVFNYAVKALNLSPSDCVVFEDSINGVVAAQRARIPCVAVTDPRWSRGDFSIADLVVGSLEDKKIYDFLGIKYV
jgi:HAD superfamily hydrolase (TIGR01509 family)